MSHRGQYVLSRGAAWALALTATLTMAVSYFDRQTLAVLAPTVTRELRISEEDYGWLISAFSLAYLVGAPLAGRLVDQIGARRGLLGAVLIWSSVAALHAVAPSFGVLFALRLALGLAEAPSFPGAAQTVQRALPPADRARGFGVLFTGSSLGAMLAPPIATWLEAQWNFRVAFLCTALIGLVWIPVWLAVAFAPRARRVLDDIPAGPARGPSSAPSTRSGALTTRSPGALELLTHPAVLRAMAVVVASSPLMMLMLNWGSKYLVHAHGLTQSEVGRYLLFPPVLLDVGAILFGHLASLRAARRDTRGSPPRLLFAVAAALCALGGAVPFMEGPGAAVAMASIAMAGGGGMSALLTADMLSRVHPSAVSTAGGINVAAQSLAYIIAAPLIGRTIAYTDSYTPILVALGLWVIPGSVLWLLWAPPPPYEKPEPLLEGQPTEPG